jgi:hypothetical protein
MTKKSCLQIGDLTPCFHAPSRAEHFEPHFSPVQRFKRGTKAIKTKNMTKRSCLQIVDSTPCFHAESRAEHFEPHFSPVRRLKRGPRPQKLKKARSILCLQIVFSTGWPGNRNIHNAVNAVTYIAHFHAPTRAEHFEPHFSPVRRFNKLTKATKARKK